MIILKEKKMKEASTPVQKSVSGLLQSMLRRNRVIDEAAYIRTIGEVVDAVYFWTERSRQSLPEFDFESRKTLAGAEAIFRQALRDIQKL